MQQRFREYVSVEMGVCKHTQGEAAKVLRWLKDPEKRGYEWDLDGN